MKKYHCKLLHKKIYQVCDEHKWHRIVLNIQNKFVKEFLQCEYCLEQKDYNKDSNEI